MNTEPKRYTNGEATWYREPGRRRWRVQSLNPAGKPYDWHTFPNRAEAESVAASIARRHARERTEFPAVSSDFFGPYAPRPSRTPYFYRKQAVAWARWWRVAKKFGDNAGIGTLDTCRSLAKMYLKSYRESLTTWHRRFGV